AQEEGPEEATPPRGCSQSEPELREGGGASAEGNFFYLSLPTGPPRPGGDIPGDISGDSPGDIPGDSPGDIRDSPGDIRDSPWDSPGDTELILRTLEELRGKLLRLRALEAAHRQLLRSLRGRDATALRVPNSVPSVPNNVPGVPSAVPSVPGRALPPPSPHSSSQAPRGHGG
ncbi:ARHGB factor, partial [Chloropsis cyanopogon]|nr:ARHGB factor [Chloropsis cyanopogon]